MFRRANPVLFVLMILLSGCDSVIDCLDNDGPEFNKSQLDPAILNQVYSDSIRASVNNEPQDQRFDYRFVFSGVLPEGLRADTVGQEYIISGTPVQSGSFPFTLYVEVDDGQNAQDSGLCYVSHTRDMLLVVEEI